MRLMLALVLFASAGIAFASETYRFDRGVVTVGDSVSALVQKAGRQPDRIVTVENSRGAAIGERWEFHLRDKQVNFETRDGRVVGIRELR